MASSATDRQVVGGFDAAFVTPLDKDLECPICLMALRDPLQTSCGHLMCTSCVDQITENRRFRCPIDNEVSQRKEAFPDKVHERRILGLLVKCDYHAHGCEWVGELRHLQDHVSQSGSCEFISVECHFSGFGCSKKVRKKDLDNHMTTFAQQHILFLLKTVARLEKENEKLKEQRIDASGSIQRTPRVCKFTWKIDKWTQKLQDTKSNGKLYSDLFYTGYHGYKLRLEARPDDKKRGYLGLYLQMMKGDYDYSLPWPFSLEFTLTLVDQQRNGKDVELTMAPKSAPAETVTKCFSQPTATKNEGIGWDTVISHSDLTKRCYVVNDTLLVELRINMDSK